MRNCFVVFNSTFASLLLISFSVQASERPHLCEVVLKLAAQKHPILAPYILHTTVAAEPSLFITDYLRHHGTAEWSTRTETKDVVETLQRWIKQNANQKIEHFHQPRVKDQDAATQAEIAKAAASFRASSSAALKHILLGDIIEAPHAPVPFNWRVKGGLHSQKSHLGLLADFLKDQSFYQEAIAQEHARGLKGYLLLNSNWVRASRVLVESAVDHVIAGKRAKDFPRSHLSRNERVDLGAFVDSIEAQMKHIKSFGLDPKDDSERVLYLLRNTFTHSISGPSQNGVIRLGFRHDFIQSKAWRKQMIPAARDGQMGLGGKTFFPSTWGESEIASAIEHLLNDPQVEILSLSRDAQNKPKNFVLEGQYQGVWIKAALYDGQLISAYPAWNQERDMTVHQASKALGEAMQKLVDLIDFMKDQGDGTTISILEAIDIYLGEDLAPRAGRNDAFWKTILDPREYPNSGSADFYGRASAQHYILEILKYSNLLRRLSKAAQN
jgi:hypothetical protein